MSEVRAEPSGWVCRACGRVAPAGFLPGGRCPADDAPFVERRAAVDHPEDPLLGQTLGGKYTIVGVLGVGGFGAVYRAIQAPVGRAVALKVIRAQTDPEVRSVLQARFFREARVVSRLSDPATVTLYDYGAEADGRLYMVFELIDGEPLSEVIAAGPMPPGRVAALLFQALGALAEAHRLGCVHRDLKPANIMLTRNALGEDAVKILDFGIAKANLTAEAEVGPSVETREGVIVGTPKFMAPEQARGRDVDGRTDLYALGCVGYNMLTGRPPFSGLSAVEVLMAQVSEPPRPFDPALGIPAPLAEVIHRALAKEPADRFQTAEEMARALAALVPGLSPTRELWTIGANTGTGLVPLQPTTAEGGTSKEMAAAMPEPPPIAAPPATRNHGRILAAMAIAGAALGALVYTLRDRPPPTEAAASILPAPPPPSDPSPTAASLPVEPWPRALAHAARGEDLLAAAALLQALEAAERDSDPAAAEHFRARALAEARFAAILDRPEVASRLRPPSPRAPATETTGRSPSSSSARPVKPAAAPTAPASARLEVPEF